MARISKAAKRDFEELKHALSEFWRDLQSPLFWIAVVIVAVAWSFPWLLGAEDLWW